MKNLHNTETFTQTHPLPKNQYPELYQFELHIEKYMVHQIVPDLSNLNLHHHTAALYTIHTHQDKKVFTASTLCTLP